MDCNLDRIAQIQDMPARRVRKLMFVEWEPPPRCNSQPSERSTARCEMPPGHDGWHCGRTPRGYWKSWPC